jgi:nucleoid-associated protein YgaU
MSQLVDDSSVKSQSMYSDAISRELDDKHKFKGKVVVVKKGDTLSSLAEKYYGDAMAFHKILKNNKNISEQSNTLYVGEKINIAY